MKFSADVNNGISYVAFLLQILTLLEAWCKKKKSK